MTPTDKFIVLKSEQRIRRVEKLRMKDDFHAVVDTVEEIATSNAEKR